MSLGPLPDGVEEFLLPYLPTTATGRPFITLTWAQSLDSRISAAPGVRTVISHEETKVMTHYLRSRHDAILIGTGTVLADDPKLSCRYKDGPSTIRPVVIDHNHQWSFSSSTLKKLVEEEMAVAPYIIVTQSPTREQDDALRKLGGEYIVVNYDKQDRWSVVFKEIYLRGIQSVMVEGGAKVINSLLPYESVDSVIVTVGPVFLGDKGVLVAPKEGQTFTSVTWWKGKQDAVMAAKPFTRK